MTWQKKFPNYFPQGCPPADAKEDGLEVYRLIKGDKPTVEDFKSYYELGKDSKSDKYPFIEYGLSVNTDYDELHRSRQGSIVLKKRFKNIAKGYTYMCTGVVLPTPNPQNQSHMTWWIYEGVRPERFFVI